MKQKSNHPDEIHQIQSNYVSLGKEQTETNQYPSYRKQHHDSDVPKKEPQEKDPKQVNNPNEEYYATFSQMKPVTDMSDNSSKLTPVQMEVVEILGKSIQISNDQITQTPTMEKGAKNA